MNGGTSDDCVLIADVTLRFPKDVKTYGIDKQFLWGRSLLVTPVLDPGVDYVVGYFPAGLWYDFYTVRLISMWRSFSVKSWTPVGLFLPGGLPAQQRRRSTSPSPAG